MTENIFGWELLLDLYDCDLERISSREWIARFAVEVVDCLKMKRFGEPFIEHFGHDRPETAGYSLVQLIETSSVVAHFSEYKRATYLDIFSCKHFDADTVAQFSQEFFAAQRAVKRCIERRSRDVRPVTANYHACGSIFMMWAQVLYEQKPVDENPLVFNQVETPVPGANEIRIHLAACGVCHTDLHIVEGDIHPTKMPILPGHQAVGVVDTLGANVTRFKRGDRAGVPWLNWINPDCKGYGTDRENLCEDIRLTGFNVDGGFAEYIVVDEKFAYPIPTVFSNEQAAPLLCAGVIGFRALRLSEIDKGTHLGLYGFGASAHIVLQIARHWGKEVYVFTRSAEHRRLAQELGAAWVGSSDEAPPHLLDSAVNFAPVGDLVVRAMQVLNRGGTVVHAGIYSTPIPQFDYQWLYEERTLRSAANSTRRDVEDLLRVAAEIPVKTEVQLYPLAEANRALQDLKHSRVRGVAVLKVG